MKTLLIAMLFSANALAAPLIIHASGKFPPGKVKVGSRLVDEKTLGELVALAAPSDEALSNSDVEWPIVVLLDKGGADALPIISRQLLTHKFLNFSVRLEPEKSARE